MIELDSVSKKFGGVQALKKVSLHIEEGETFILLGPSGSGKSTLLKTINRLIEPDEGAVLVGGRNIRTFSYDDIKKTFGYVIQSIGLFPHMNVFENISIIPRLLKWPKNRIKDRVEELLALVGLDPSMYMYRFPSELSGGEAQRVGLARALAADPPVLLMDEPFGALDPLTRKKLQEEFIQLQKTFSKTIVFVTHDIIEAALLGKRIAIMKDGEIKQVGTPEQIWRNPSDSFVEDFIGKEFSLHILSKHSVEEIPLVQLNGEFSEDVPVVSRKSTLKEAISEMIKSGKKEIYVEGENGQVAGKIVFENLLQSMKNNGNIG